MSSVAQRPTPHEYETAQGSTHFSSCDDDASISQSVAALNLLNTYDSTTTMTQTITVTVSLPEADTALEKDEPSNDQLTCALSTSTQPPLSLPQLLKPSSIHSAFTPQATHNRRSTHSSYPRVSPPTFLYPHRITPLRHIPNSHHNVDEIFQRQHHPLSHAPTLPTANPRTVTVCHTTNSYTNTWQLVRHDPPRLEIFKMLLIVTILVAIALGAAWNVVVYFINFPPNGRSQKQRRTRRQREAVRTGGRLEESDACGSEEQRLLDRETSSGRTASSSESEGEEGAHTLLRGISKLSSPITAIPALPPIEKNKDKKVITKRRGNDQYMSVPGGDEAEDVEQPSTAISTSTSPFLQRLAGSRGNTGGCGSPYELRELRHIVREAVQGEATPTPMQAPITPTSAFVEPPRETMHTATRTASASEHAVSNTSTPSSTRSSSSRNPFFLQRVPHPQLHHRRRVSESKWLAEREAFLSDTQSQTQTQNYHQYGDEVPGSRSSSDPPETSSSSLLSSMSNLEAQTPLLGGGFRGGNGNANGSWRRREGANRRSWLELVDGAVTKAVDRAVNWVDNKGEDEGFLLPVAEGEGRAA